MNQTESYIILKPIAERFSRVANEITDDEIKTLIKSELRERIKIEVENVIDFSPIEEMVSDYLDKNKYEIINLIAKGIENKLK